MIPNYLGRKTIVEKIEQYVGKHNHQYPGKLTFMRIDWTKTEIIMHYRSCCGAVVTDEHFSIAERNLLSIYGNEILWFFRRNK